MAKPSTTNEAIPSFNLHRILDVPLNSELNSAVYVPETERFFATRTALDGNGKTVRFMTFSYWCVRDDGISAKCDEHVDWEAESIPTELAVLTIRGYSRFIVCGEKYTGFWGLYEADCKTGAALSNNAVVDTTKVLDEKQCYGLETKWKITAWKNVLLLHSFADWDNYVSSIHVFVDLKHHSEQLKSHSMLPLQVAAMTLTDNCLIIGEKLENTIRVFDWSSTKMKIGNIKWGPVQAFEGAHVILPSGLILSQLYNENYNAKLYNETGKKPFVFYARIDGTIVHQANAQSDIVRLIVPGDKTFLITQNHALELQQ